MSRRERRRPRATGVVQAPWRRIRVPYPPLEVLSREQVELIHDRALAILEELGLEVLSEEALPIFRDAGCDLSPADAGTMVRFSRGLVEDLIGRAPAQIALHARNPERDIVVGGEWINFTTVSGPPNASDLAGGRRPGNFQDQTNLIKLAHQLNAVTMLASPSVEAQELPAESRHLDVSRSFATLTDKCWGARAIGRRRVLDAVEINRLARGLTVREAFDRPGIVANINTNSPRRVDAEMIGGLMGLVEAGQPVMITPFTLSGAMSPVTLAGSLVQQHAEAMGILAYVQMVRPGAAMVYGGFTSNVDMKSGAPVFGSPEYVRAVIAGGQLARHLGLPYRSSNVNASNAVDAQATYESLMSLWAVVLGHANIVWHGLGWLEGGLTASFEKMVLDAEMVQMMAAALEPLKFDDDELGLKAIEEVPPGGHFFGVGHTLERYDRAFYAPILSDWRNFESWEEAGSPDATQRAHETYKQLLAAYEEPTLEPERIEAIDAFVAKRKQEIEAKGLA
ncbi:MAG: trimethylamine methyltransferase family protein [Alphaproteobacteria bacterium]|nr:trimethylamine methyltransferase family protein [Alphaproteobacteria bacterium]